MIELHSSVFELAACIKCSAVVKGALVRAQSCPECRSIDAKHCLSLLSSHGKGGMNTRRHHLDWHRGA